MNTHYDVAIVGSGIVGLAFAYACRKAGLKVGVFERNPKALGASIRNFGMIWPIGQTGQTIERALYARNTWLQLADEAGFWAQPWGSIHVAYQEDELNVLEEFHATTQHLPYETEMLTPVQTMDKSNAINPIGLEGAMYSSTEVNVDPREAIQKLHSYFRASLNIDFHYHTAITHIDGDMLSSAENTWKAGHIFVCSGSDFETLFPKTFREAGITKCKLQMMRTGPQPKGWNLGPNLAGGLTLQHYASFNHCESLAALKARIANELGEYNKWGIHVMMSQGADGSLIIGDSHEYGLSPTPFDQHHINQLIIKYLAKFAKVPSLEIAEYWNGVYAKLPNQTECVLKPSATTTIVNALGGAGMTLSFGLANPNFPIFK